MSDRQAEHSGLPTTGDPSVDAAVDGLDDLDDRPTSEHLEVLARAHEQLHAELSREAAPGAGTEA